MFVEEETNITPWLQGTQGHCGEMEAERGGGSPMESHIGIFSLAFLPESASFLGPLEPGSASTAGRAGLTARERFLRCSQGDRVGRPGVPVSWKAELLVV